MTHPEQITAAEATAILGHKNRSSLTRLVQAGGITPIFTASGKRGEQFFNRADVLALVTPVVAPSPAAAGASSVGGAA